MSTLKSCGEFNLIERIRNRIAGVHPDVVIGIGDDTAAIRPSPGMLLLPTTDTFVEGVDFDLDFSEWTHIGWKCMAANLSDIAAMGGAPRYALVTLCMRNDRLVEEVEALYGGLLHLAVQFDVAIIGGDMSGTPGPATVSITLIGEAPDNRVIRRSGAQVGDQVCVTGHLGASDAGLRMLQHARQHPGITGWQTRYAATLEKHRTPMPRVREGQILAESGGINAMIDISDGLSADALHMARSSRAGISLNVAALPINDETRAVARDLGVAPLLLALNSGEEFELLCAIAPDKASEVLRRVTDTTGTSMTIIGEITSEADGYTWRDETGSHPLISGGYEHFKR